MHARARIEIFNTANNEAPAFAAATTPAHAGVNRGKPGKASPVTQLFPCATHKVKGTLTVAVKDQRRAFDAVATAKI